MWSMLYAFVFISVVSLNIQAEPCHFALDFTTENLLQDPVKRCKFLNLVMEYEGKFNQPGVGYNSDSGYTYDGHGINYMTGELKGRPRSFSAASKESLQVSILALALQGNYPLAVRYLQAGKKAVNATERALQIFTAKISTYERFSTSYPGYGGFLPWAQVNDYGIFPNPDDTVPSLDNGQLMWALYLTCHVLKDIGQVALGDRYCHYFDMMVQNAKTVFYEGDGKVLSVAVIVDPKAPVSRSNRKPNNPTYYLEDPYEGELFTVILDLFSNWSSTAERDKLWTVKKNAGHLASVRYTTKSSGPITVQKGWFYSSHEMWKFLVLPYTDVDIARRVFVNGEKARTWHSSEKSIPGLFASVHDLSTGSIDPRYESACGIQELAWSQIHRMDIVTPYASFPVILANHSVGLAWYHSMLQGTKMQGPYGSTVACSIYGTKISPLLTWDAKQTTVLSLLGGTGDLIKKYLPKQLLERFKFVIDRDYSAVFNHLDGEQLDFKLPLATIPWGHLQYFASCVKPAGIETPKEPHCDELATAGIPVLAEWKTLIHEWRIHEFFNCTSW